MAYNTKPIVTDVDGNPISQYYNPDTDSYEPVEGSHGANKVLVENNDLSLIPILEKLSQLTGTVIDEETRKSNELQRIALYNQIKQMLENGELKGEKGDTGIGLNYRWQGTYLGIKREDETEFVYVDLKGEKGDKGDKGDPGVIENLTKQHVLNALQYTPVKSVNNVMPDGSGNVEIDIDISEIENRIGNVEDDLVAHKADGVHGRVEATNTDDATSIVDAPLKSAGGLAVAKKIIVGEGIELNKLVDLPLPIPSRGSIIHYTFTLPNTNWTTVVDVGSSNYVIHLTGLIGGSDKRSVRGFSLIYGRGGSGNYDPYLILFGGSEEFIRLDGTALQFRSQWAGYGLNCYVFLSRIL